MLSVSLDHTQSQWAITASGGDDQASILVEGIPPHTSESILKEAFASFGDVSHVFLKDAVEPRKPDLPGKPPRARIVFASPKGAKSALRGRQKPVKLATPPPRTGLSRWMSSYWMTRPPAPQLKGEADSAVAAYWMRLKEEEAAKEAEHNRMDADGFVLVQKRRGKRNSSREGTTTVSAVNPMEIVRIHPSPSPDTETTQGSLHV